MQFFYKKKQKKKKLRLCIVYDKYVDPNPSLLDENLLDISTFDHNFTDYTNYVEIINFNSVNLQDVVVPHYLDLLCLLDPFDFISNDEQPHCSVSFNLTASISNTVAGRQSDSVDT